MKRIAFLAAAVALATNAYAQSSCPAGRTIADFGFGEIDCRDCMPVHATDGLSYISFRSQPVLRSIRSGGPAAGKLNEGDTLLSIDGLPITGVAGARRLSEGTLRASELVVRRNGVVRRVSITPVAVCPNDGPKINRNGMSKDEVLQSSASALAQLQQSNAEQVRAEVERAGAVRLQFEQDLASRDALEAAVRRVAVADSLAVSRATQLYAVRAITRRQFDDDVGRIRAEAIISATQDTSRTQAARNEAILEAQFRQQRLLRWRSDSSNLASLVSTVGRMDSLARGAAVRDSAARIISDQVGAQRADVQRRLEEVLRNRPELPTMSLGMGLLCSGGCATDITGRRSVWTFSSYPVVGAVEPGSVADRLGLLRGDTLKTIDDINVTTRQGGERLSAITPNRTIKLGWSRAGVAHTASVTLAAGTLREALSAARLSQTVGNAAVEIFGRGASWTRDPQTGALRITGDSITVIVRPPAATRDTLPRTPDEMEW